MEPTVVLVREPIDLTPWREAVASPYCGAVVTFEGIVRNHDEGRSVTAITYEAYEEMARKEMGRIAGKMTELWPEVHLVLIHRLGQLRVGEVSVAVLAASPHRAEAFAAAQYCIDSLKRRVPIWKKEESSGTVWWKGSPKRSPAKSI